MAKRNSGFTGELLHFNATRIRVVGEGNLKQAFYGFDDINSEELNESTLTSTAGPELSTLANFRDQHGQLEVSVDTIDEWFTISKLTIFVKQLASGYPQS